MSIVYTVLLLSFGIAWSGDTDGCDGTDVDNWDIDYTGSSTKFEFYSTCEKDKAYIRVEMKEINELAVNEKNDSYVSDNKITSFSNKDYDWESTTGDDTTYQGNDAIINKFTGTEYEVGKDKDLVAVSIQTVLFKEDGSVTVNDDFDEDVYEFEMKFSVNITDWPWLNVNNTLQIFMEIETKEIDSKDKDDDDDKNKDKYKAYVFGDQFNLKVPNKYLCGDLKKNVTSTVDTKDGLKIDLFFEFEYCDDTMIMFDPFVFAQTATSNSFKNNNLVNILFVIFIVGYNILL